MTTHTPGPWQAKLITQGKLKGHFDVGPEYSLAAHGGSGVAQVNGLYDEEAVANAALIAAAPTLLTALEQAPLKISERESDASFVARYNEWFTLVMKPAIAAARGGQ